MEYIQEVRYPWANAIDFWAGGYWREIESSHLFFGWVYICWLTVSACCSRRTPVEFRLATLYFALTVYSNFAYNVFNLNANEVFGILSILSVVLQGRLRCGRLASRAAQGLALVFSVGIIHMLVSALAYPVLLPDMFTTVTKIAVNFKILILAANMAIVGTCVARGVDLDRLIKTCVSAGVVAQLMYLLQVAITFTGTLPYGTFLDAGFVGVPSFGSVSIERGHMGKFIAPYFAFFLYALLQWKWRWRFALFLLTSAINFSASGQVFLACSLMIAIFVFRHSLGVRAYGLIALCTAGMTGLIVTHWTVFEAIVNKIVTIAVQGDESQGGGRSFGLFLEYITTFPLGMGYSGSTLRTAPNLPEINAAFFAFISQYSLLAGPILLGFVLLLIRTFRLGLRGGTLGRCMLVGVAMAPIIFFVDILWFVPMVWLPIEVILSSRDHWRHSMKPIAPCEDYSCQSAKFS